MNYEETIQYLYNQLPVYQHVGGSAYKEGLDNSLELDLYFGHPHLKYRNIHIAGTNGKGSTSHLLAAILQQAGYKVGLYTSPHLVDFRERIRVNGKKITEEYVIDFVDKHKSNYEQIYPSFFELTMMMAFCYFADMDVEVGVIETGLGGRLDSTNIISPIVSVITNIGIDHTQYLGDTLEKIAKEKAGIIKPHIPVVIGEAEGSVRKVFEEKAIEENAPIVFAQDQSIIESGFIQKNGSWLYESKMYPNLEGELGGLPQIKNSETVLTTLEVLKSVGIKINNEAIYEGFSHVVELTGLQGRWQVLKTDNPRIICDTGHNVDGIKYITEQLKHENYKNLYMVIGLVNDKDIDSILSLLPKDALYFFTKANIARACNEIELARLASKHQLVGKPYPSVKDAISASISFSDNQNLIFIGGSNFIVAEALSFFS